MWPNSGARCRRRAAGRTYPCQLRTAPRRRPPGRSPGAEAPPSSPISPKDSPRAIVRRTARVARSPGRCPRRARYLAARCRRRPADPLAGRPARPVAGCRSRTRPARSERTSSGRSSNAGSASIRLAASTRQVVSRRNRMARTSPVTRRTRLRASLNRPRMIGPAKNSTEQHQQILRPEATLPQARRPVP